MTNLQLKKTCFGWRLTMTYVKWQGFYFSTTIWITHYKEILIASMCTILDSLVNVQLFLVSSGWKNLQVPPYSHTQCLVRSKLRLPILSAIGLSCLVQARRSRIMCGKGNLVWFFSCTEKNVILSRVDAWHASSYRSNLWFNLSWLPGNYKLVFQIVRIILNVTNYSIQWNERWFFSRLLTRKDFLEFACCLRIYLSPHWLFEFE